MGYTLSRRKHGREVLSKSKKRRSITIISHSKSNESNHLNTSNSDNFIGTPNFPHTKVQNDSSFNTLITLQK